MKQNNRLLLSAILLSFALRLALAGWTWGTSDTFAFINFASSIDRQGLLDTYRTNDQLNHPPIPAYWSWIALRLAGHSPALFIFIFRLPAILADAGSTWLLTKIGRGRRNLSPLSVAALFALSPTAILISAYHGNTDSIYAFLSLLAVYLLNVNRPMVAGLALAAAMNIKLIPILLILPLIASLRKWKDAGRFAVGLCAAIVPFLYPLIGARSAFFHNAVAYSSRLDLWGFNLFLSGASSDLSQLPHAVVIYRELGRYLIVCSVVIWSLLARWDGRWNRFDIAAVTYAIFLVFASGFGVQYLVAILPLLFAARRRLATVYGLLAGVFIFAAYYIYWDGSFPISSLFTHTLPPMIGFIGLGAWGTLVYYLARVGIGRSYARVE